MTLLSKLLLLAIYSPIFLTRFLNWLVNQSLSSAILNHFQKEASKTYVSQWSFSFLVERPHSCIIFFHISLIYQFFLVSISFFTLASAKLSNGIFTII